MTLPAIPHLPPLAQTSCGSSWQYGLLEDKPLIYRLKEKSLVEITYNVEVNLEIYSCYNVSDKVPHKKGRTFPFLKVEMLSFSIAASGKAL
jgi:hypothetical protein